MTRSTSATSGCSSPRPATASSPSAASPTTSMSSCSSSKRAQPLPHDRVVVGHEHADHARHLQRDRRPLAGPRSRISSVPPAAAPAPPSRSARAGATAAPPSRGRSRPRRRRPSAAGPAGRLEPHVDVLRAGVGQRVVQRLLCDAEDLAVALRSRQMLAVDAERRSPGRARAAAPRRACAARSRAPPARAPAAAARRRATAARPSPRARAPAPSQLLARRRRVAVEQRRGRLRGEHDPEEPLRRPRRADRARAGSAPRRRSAPGCARTAARSRSRSPRARPAPRSADGRPRRTRARRPCR